jgi:hypothetical protein
METSVRHPVLASIIPLSVWLLLAVVQSWLCIRFLWESNLPVAVVIIVVIFLAPLANRWRMQAWAARQWFNAAALSLAVFMGEGYVLNVELGSWIGGRDRDVADVRNATTQKERVSLLADADAKRIASAPRRPSAAIQADITREMSKQIKIGHGQTDTLGRLTKDCTDTASEVYRLCKAALDLRPDFETAKAAEDAERSLRTAVVTPKDTSTPTPPDQMAFARALSRIAGGVAEDWANAFIFAGALSILIIREFALAQAPMVHMRRKTLDEAPRLSGFVIRRAASAPLQAIADASAGTVSVPADASHGVSHGAIGQRIDTPTDTASDTPRKSRVRAKNSKQNKTSPRVSVGVSPRVSGPPSLTVLDNPEWGKGITDAFVSEVVRVKAIHGSIRATATAMGVSPARVQRALEKATADGEKGGSSLTKGA